MISSLPIREEAEFSDVEERRLTSLHDANLIEEPEFPELEALCEVLQQRYDVSGAFVSLIDRDSQWFVAGRGFRHRKTSRRDAFCNHTIRQEEPLVVPDTLVDARFSGSNWAKVESVRFYAGVPLSVDPGLRLGSLCIADREPRSLNDEDVEDLKKFGLIASFLLRVRAASRAVVRSKDDLERQNVVVLKQAEELWRQHRTLSQAEQLARIGTWQWSLEDDVVHWSDEIFRMTGVPKQGSLLLEQAMTIFPSEHRDRVEDAVRAARLNGTHVDLEVCYRTTNGERRWARLVGEGANRDGEVRSFFGVFQDISEQHAHADALTRLANHDQLTGLPNRGCFLAELQKVASTPGRRFAVMLIDLDDFRVINDTQGYDVGNALLVEFGRRLRGVAEPDDFVGYVGGDEFAVILGNCPDVETALRKAEGIRRVFSSDAFVERRPVSCRGSSGLVLCPDHGENALLLFQNVDIALNRAKMDGGDATCVFDPPMRAAFERRIDQISRFRQALATGSVLAHYQPQVDARNGRFTGLEALARWREPSGRIVPASEFQAAFEDPVAAIKLGERMIQAVTADLKAMLDEGREPPRICINVSAFELWRGDYPSKIAAAFAARDVPLNLLGVEVTESVFLDRPGADVAGQLGALRSMGVTISLDDFGTGYASLSHLKRYPIDQLKIDRSFVTNLVEDSSDQAIVQSILLLARTLGIGTVAEGVETEEQATCLRNLGCDYLQGYLIGRPMPIDEIRSRFGLN